MSSNSGHISIQKLKNKAVIADKCHVAECFVFRLRGLIGRTSLEPGEGMLFPKCNSVHTWLMSIAIDVVFLRKELRKEPREDCKSGAVFTVLSVHHGVKPWRIFPLYKKGASETLELPAGIAGKYAIEAGDELCIS